MRYADIVLTKRGLHTKTHHQLLTKGYGFPQCCDDDTRSQAILGLQTGLDDDSEGRNWICTAALMAISSQYEPSTAKHARDAIQSYPSVCPSLGMWKPSILVVTSFTPAVALPLAASLSSALGGLSCQIRMVPSSDPEAYDSPPGANRTQWTGPWCPLLQAAY